VEITYASAPDLDGLKADFTEDGALNNAAGGDTIGAVSISARLLPGQSASFPIILSWDMPVVEGFTENDWYREYTRYFGRTGTNSWNIAKEALKNASEWEASIDNWQTGILADPAYPDWLKTSLFNELYYYTAGGTVWEAGAASGQPDDPEEDMFSSLECFDYPYYGTSDVRFYGSWALLELWPELDKQCVRQFCDSVYTEREDRPRPLGTAAHDFGAYGSAFKKWNAYNFRDSTNWRDLNSKLVLMVYRDWAMTGKTDSEFLEYCWIPVRKAMERVKSQDADGDGLPDSNGIDQTYDNMLLTGNTAYCGGLFLAACEAAGEIAGVMGDTGLSDTYRSWLEKGKASFEEKLWNGSYYRIDTGSEDTSRIMADQLCGQWYAVACGLPGIVPDASAKSAFNKIYEYNFKKFDGGANGIVNVVLPSGEIETTGQSAECWVGTSWGVAAGMLQQGMTAQADEIGQSLFNAVWDRGELWFRTPEAWQTGISGVRSPYYMRATTVWAVKHAYDIGRVKS
jgi:non-lysosomal glucosylceramidase